LLATAAEVGSFDAYLASVVPAPPARLPASASAGDIPATTPMSDALSRDLKRRGFRFVGSTIVYAFMQSVGLVDDHLPGCFRYQG
jgi:3-methyladenine DNA glycosylase Tag